LDRSSGHQVIRSSERLPAHPAQVHGGARREIAFRFNGQAVPAYEGDTVAAALFTAGRRVFTRSFKYHRPRGLLCCAGRCPNCLMNVDGTPNVRTCVTPVRAGMEVRHQNAWPTLEADALAFLGRLESVLPVGFYYKTFMEPRALWPVYEQVLRHVGGLGVVERGSRPAGYHHEYRHTEVAVVGGGPAGMSAALAAARSGCRVTLIDEGEALGGALRGETRALLEDGEWSGVPGFEIAARMAVELEAAGVSVWSRAVAFGVYEGGQLGVQRERALIELRYQRLVIATGAYERPAVFAGNDLPGVMLGSGARRLLWLYGVRPGRRAVVATAHDEGLALAEELQAAGVELAAVADSRPADAARSPAFDRLRAAGVTVLPETTVVKAYGGLHLEQVALTTDGRKLRWFRCDLLCVPVGWEPALSLLAQNGAGRPGWDAERGVFSADAGDGEILAAGSVCGVGELADCLAYGAAAGQVAGELVGAERINTETRRHGGEGARSHGESGVRSQVGSWPALEEPVVSPVLGVSSVLPGHPDAQRRRFVCFCEDVTEKDIAQAVAEGFDHIETLKRYSTASMGPCQGRMCRGAVSELCGGYTEQAPEAVGVSRARPPALPVTLGALGAEHAAPVRRTPMHHRHAELGARFIDLGEWKRPEVYSSVEEECRAVRERVGLIDVGTLGKLEVVGKDAAALLEKVYTNRFRDVAVGRVRYGVVCDDSGIILDDGTFARVEEERWFLTTTSGGVEAMDQWLRWWSAPGPGGTRPCVHVTNRTSGLAAVNLAGPRSREVLSRVTELDLSPEAFPYLGARRAMVAGVRALLLRIGFVGELGYEIHYPAEYGVHVWDALLEAGREFGIQPFGVEAQRVLRLEKQHLIVGHDTDALSNPLDARMPWIVKWEKEDFVGRPSLRRLQDGGSGENGRPTLVGFTVEDTGVLLPEGSQVVREGMPVGRVTSYRLSPTLGKGIGLAWVPGELASEGAEIRIAGPRGCFPASVTLRAFYDPEGLRVRA
jgi:sarcosine oxidase, subunit alpha